MNNHVFVEEIENKYVLRIKGRIDTLSTAPIEKQIEELLKQNHYQILADFTEVEYLSSAGLRLLLSVTKKLQAKNGRLVIFSVDDDVFSIIKMAGFERILTIRDTEKDALQSFS